MNSVTIDNQKILVPSSYNELNAKQLRKIVQVQLSKVYPIQARGLFLKILLWKDNWWFKQLPDHGIADMLLLTDWLFEKNDKGIEVYKAPNLIKNKFPTIKRGDTVYHSPSDGLSNITVIEWARAETYFLRYSKKQTEADLTNLMAVLYRPIDPKKSTIDDNYNGDLRQRYSDFTHAKRAKELSRVGMFTKMSVFYFYSGCRAAIISNPNYYEVFNSKETKKVKSNPDKTWIDFIIDLSGSNWGDKAVDEISYSLIHTVLYQLNKMLLNK